MASLEKSPPAITERLGDVLYSPTAVRETRYRVVEQIGSCSRREPGAACQRSEGHH